MKLNNTRPFEYWLKLTESLSTDKLKEHVLAFFIKYGAKYYDSDASILEYLQNNDEDNSSEEDVKTLKEALKKALYANESNMTKYKVGDILPNGKKVYVKTLNINNNDIIIDTLMPIEAEVLVKKLKNNGFEAENIKTGSYYHMVLIPYNLPFEHGKFASIVEDTLDIIYLNSSNKRIRDTNKFNESKDVTELTKGDKVNIKSSGERAIIVSKVDSTNYIIKTKSGDERRVNLNAIEPILSIGKTNESVSNDTLKKVANDAILKKVGTPGRNDIYQHNNFGPNGPYYLVQTSGAFYTWDKNGNFDKSVPTSFIQSKLNVVGTFDMKNGLITDKK